MGERCPGPAWVWSVSGTMRGKALLPIWRPDGAGMSNYAIWHGTQAESRALLQAIARNCGCEYGLMGMRRRSTCGAHRMLTEEQRALDGLLFARRVAHRLRREEFSTTRAVASAQARQGQRDA